MPGPAIMVTLHRICYCRSTDYGFPNPISALNGVAKTWQSLLTVSLGGDSPS